MKEKQTERPNILFILADQLRRTGLGCYGNPDVSTPVIDRLCREGLQFPQRLGLPGLRALPRHHPDRPLSAPAWRGGQRGSLLPLLQGAGGVF